MKKNTLPEGFIVVSLHAPQFKIDLKYCGSDNLIARPLKGYANDGSAILTSIATQSLLKISSTLKHSAVKQEIQMVEPTIVILDAYRPAMACEDFWEWSQSDCEKTKKDYYPNVDKRDFFELGYIARNSSHSRGSTVDVTIMDALTGQFISMGTRFDFMDPLSHPDNPNVSATEFKNRQFLKKLMNDGGWEGIKTEWWHFTFKDEPFPNTYFNFPVINYSS